MIHHERSFCFSLTFSYLRKIPFFHCPYFASTSIGLKLTRSVSFDRLPSEQIGGESHEKENCGDQ